MGMSARPELVNNSCQNHSIRSSNRALQHLRERHDSNPSERQGDRTQPRTTSAAQNSARSDLRRLLRANRRQAKGTSRLEVRARNLNIRGSKLQARGDEVAVPAPKNASRSHSGEGIPPTPARPA